MLQKINSKSKKIIFGILFSVLVLIFLGLLFFSRDSKIIKDINEFIKTDTKVLYISDGNKDSKKLIELLKKYDVNILEINSTKLNLFESKKVEKIVHNKYLNDIIVIFENGKIRDALIEYETEKSFKKFLQKNDIIPEIISNNVSEIMNEIDKMLDSDYSMVYIPYENNDLIEEQDNIFRDIANKYLIEYKRIDAYLLGYNQKEKINQILGLSFVDDQILIMVKDKKMIGNIRGIHSKNTYIENLSDLNFIKELENKIKNIDYHTFKQKLTTDEKSIIVIGNDNSKDCDEILNILNGMIYSYNINVDYINVGNIDSSLYKDVKRKIENLGYKDGFSLPMVIVVESNNILSQIIGNSKEEYFLDVFIENGVIKGENKDE